MGMFVQERLGGDIAVDIVHVTGVPVAIAVKQDGRGVGKFQINQLKRDSLKEIEGFIDDCIRPEARVHMRRSIA